MSAILSFDMTDVLSEDIISNHIFSRLPINSVGAARCVSRRWCSTFSSPDFVKNHQIIHAETDEAKYLMSEDSPFTMMKTLQVLTVTNTNAHFSLLNVSFMRKTTWVHDYLVVSGSCNGLLLLHALPFPYKSVVMNPITREEAEILPRCPQLFSDHREVGLGYDSLKDDYKVVSFTNRENCYVYSLKTKSMRVIEPSPYEHLEIHPFSKVSLNDRIQWLAIDPHSGVDAIIASYDVTREKFEKTPLPSGVGVGLTELSAFDIKVYRGRLALMSKVSPDCTDVWVMEGYGSVGSSWKKLTTINFPPKGPASSGWETEMNFVECLYFLSEDEIVVQMHSYERLFVHNWRTGTWRDFFVGGLIKGGVLSRGITFKESLVSPNYNYM